MKEIKLSQGKVALVSDEDFERVSKFRWTYHVGSGSGEKAYAVRNPQVKGKRTWIRMHRFILDLPPGSIDGMVVDHIDENGLNNQRENLEIVTPPENSRRSAERRTKKVEPHL